MKAKSIIENISFEKGKDPKDAMGIGLKQKIYNAMAALNQEDGVLGMRVRKDTEGNDRLVVKYVGDIWKPILGNKSYWEELVNKHIGEYVKFNMGNPDDEYFSFPIHPKYRQIIRDLIDYDVNEGLDFERGRDPKEVMGIGEIYYIKMDRKTVSMGRGSISATTTWDLYDRDMKLIKSHRQGSWNKEYDGWKNFVKAQGIHPKFVKRIYESLDFERGRDPKEAMGIGNQMVRLANKLGEDFSGLRWLRNSLRGFMSSNSSKEEFKEDLYVFHENPEEFQIERNGSYYQDIEWALDNFEDAWEVANLTDDQIYITEDDIKESVSFERGKDPKHSMNIGLGKKIREGVIALDNTPDIGPLALDTYQGDLCLEVAYPMFLGWNRVNVAVYEKIPKECFRHVPGTNGGAADDSDGVRFYMIKPEYYDVFCNAIAGVSWENFTGHVNIADLNEAQRFERGGDPLERIGIGDQEHRDVQKIDKVAKTFGFHKRPEFSREPESHLIDVAEWWGPKGEILVYTRNKFGEKDYFWWLESRGKPGTWIDEEGTLEDILNPKVWNNILSGEPLHYELDESQSFQRGRDPLDALGIGIKDVKQLGPLAKRPTHVLKRDGYTSISRGYMLWKLLKFIDDKNQKGELVGYMDCVKYYYHKLKSEPHRRSFSRGPWENLQQYIVRDDNRKYSLGYNGKNYLRRYSFFDDGRETIDENISFERGKDPKEAMKIGREDIRLIKILQKNADRFGYEKLEDVNDAMDPENWVANVNVIAVWKKPKTEEEVVLIYDKDESEYQVVGFCIDPTLEDIDELRTPNEPYMWYDSFYWEAVLNPELLNESVSFERGKDPKEAIGIGQLKDVWRLKNLLRISTKGGIPRDVPVKIKFAEEILTHPRFKNRSSTTAVQFEDDDEMRLDRVFNAKKNLIFNGKFWRWTDMGWEPEILNEDISFERGKDPKEAMDIGLVHEIRKMINKSTDYISRIQYSYFDKKSKEIIVAWDSYPDAHSNFTALAEYMHEIFPDILIQGNEWYGEKEDVYHFPVKPEYIPSVDKAFHWHSKDELNIKEGLDFERGQDPKRSMGIGFSMTKDSLDFKDWEYKNSKFHAARFYNNGEHSWVIWYLPDKNDHENKIVVLTDIPDKHGVAKIMEDHILNKYIPFLNSKNESVDFERGKDPLDAMGIGLSHLKDKLWKQFSTDFDVNYLKPISAKIYRGWECLCVKYRDQRKAYQVVWIVPFGNGYTYGENKRYTKTEKGAYERAERLIDKKKEILGESVDFERGKDPKSAMKIGMLRSPDEMTDLFDDIQELVCTSSYSHFQKEFRGDVMSLIPDDMQGNHGWGNIHLSFKQLPRDILYDFDRLIEKYSQLMGLNESVYFERGKDPKDAMGIGMRYLEIHGVSNGYESHGNWFTPDHAKEILRNVNISGKRNVWVLYDTPEFTKNQDSLDFILTKDFMNDVVAKQFNYIKYEGEYFPVDHLVESVYFERGKDPKETMDIGMRIFDIDGMGYEKQNGEFAFEQTDTESLLSTPSLWDKEPFKVLLLTKLIPPTGWKSYSLDYLANGPGEYDYVRYKGKLYPIPNPKNRITESVSFKRGKDPKKILGIGLSFENLPNGAIVKPKEGVSTTGFGPLSRLKGGKMLRIEKSNDLGLNVPGEHQKEIFYSILGPVGNVVEPYNKEIKKGWTMGKTWFDNTFDIINLSESVSFERGQDPKRAMSIGRVQAVKKWLEYFDLEDRSEIDVISNKNITVLVHGGITFSKFGRNPDAPDMPLNFPMDGLHIEGSFYMDRSEFQELPKRLYVEGNTLNLTYYKGKNLPEKLFVNGDLTLDQPKNPLVIPDYPDDYIKGNIRIDREDYKSGHIKVPEHLTDKIEFIEYV